MKFKFFAYSIFIAGCLILSLYVHFPGKTAATYMEQRVSQFNSNIKVQIQTLKPCFPPGLTAESILISYAGTPETRIENLRSVIDLTTLFSDVRKGSFFARAFDGDITGRFRVPKEEPAGMGGDIQISAVKLKNIPLGRFLSGCNFSGILTGAVTAEVQGERRLKSKGEIEGSDLVLQFPKTLFSVETYSFSSGKVKFALSEKNIVTIEDCTMNGRQIDIHASGELRLADKFDQSALSVKARLVLYPLFFMNAGDALPIDISKGNSENVTINLSIGGTIQNPRITLGQGSK